MGFKFNPAPTFKAMCPLTMPGQAEPVVMEVEFRHKGAEALRLWNDSLTSGADPRSPVDMLNEVIVWWSGPLDDKGEPVPYSREALALLIDNYPTAGPELFSRYQRELREGRVKN